MNTKKIDDFVSKINDELAILENEGFFSGNNWTYTLKDILSLYNNLPNDIKKECIDFYPKVVERIEQDNNYIDQILLKNNSELEGFINNYHGNGAYDKLSEKMREDSLLKKQATNTGIARYYLFFLLINIQNINHSPRILIDNIKSFNDYYQAIQGLLLFKNLRYLNIKGNISMKSFIEFNNNVEIIVDPKIDYTLASESVLDNIKLLVDDKGQVFEENI